MGARIQPGDARPSLWGQTQRWNGRGGRRVGLEEGGSQERGRGSERGSGLACKGSRLFLRGSPFLAAKIHLNPKRSSWTSRMCQGLYVLPDLNWLLITQEGSSASTTKTLLSEARSAGDGTENKTQTVYLPDVGLN